MKLKIIILAISFGLLFTACGEKPVLETNPPANAVASSAKSSLPTEVEGFKGYVVSVDGFRMLVVSPDVRDFSASGGIENFYNAIWFSHIPADIQIGMKVEVWSDGPIAESYPGQGSAERVTVLSKHKPAGAKLTEAEAIQKAISLHHSPDANFPVVTGTEYDATAAKWIVYMASKDRDAVIPIEVK